MRRQITNHKLPEPRNWRKQLDDDTGGDAVTVGARAKKFRKKKWVV
jgi:hypothetical protein